jgi:nitrous oxidase accessory protein
MKASRTAAAAVTYCIILVTILAAQPAKGGESLQSRIDAAREGDTVFVGAGTYNENITIAKRIHLVGAGSPVIRGTGKGSIITILALGCTVSGFVVEHCGTMLVNEDAGILVKAGRTLISGNTLRDILFGIYLYQSDSNVVARNTIVGRRELDQGGRGSGIHVWNSNHNVLEGNTISETRDGIYIQNANHTMIRDNEVFDLRYGLHYMYADTNTFIRNVFRDNVAGAAIMFTKHIVLKHNVFIRNRGFASYGLLLQDCHESVADSNVIADNVVGIFFEASTGNVFRHNVVARNDLALEMFQTSTGNAFTENNFIDNLNPLTIVGRRTESSWSVGGKGNFWSAYDGYDLDGDGVGDVPMNIENVFSYLEGKNANVRLYLYSPASQALEASARAFPILDVSGERDEHPLTGPIAVEMPALPGAGPSTGESRSSEAGPIPWVMSAVATGLIVAYRFRRRRYV